MQAIKNYKDLLKKVEKVAIRKDLDLSSSEDLSIAIMNLVSIEEHLFFTSQKTKDNKYLDLLNEVRLMRTELLKEIIKDYAGEVWCISKHLLASSMRLMEVGTKELKKGNAKKANKLFDNAYRLYSLFWALNLSDSSSKKTAKQHMSDNSINYFDEKGEKKTAASVFSKLGEIINKVLDCCRE